MENIRQGNNGFSRTNINEAKMGYYPTEREHMKSLSTLLKFPERKEFCVLEPSAGEGAAVEVLTRPDLNEGAKIFCVELDQQRAEVCRNNPAFEQTLCEDFLNGVKISNNCFTLCFGNPPYMSFEDDVFRERLENRFLEKVTANYLKIGGVLVWVIPYKSFIENWSIRYFLNHYKDINVWRFRADEYAKYHQVAIVARKTATSIHLADDITQFRKRFEVLEAIPELPVTFEGTKYFQSYEILPSASDNVKLFTTLKFDAVAALELILSDENKKPSKYSNAVAKRMTQKQFAVLNVGKPPIPPKKDSLYLIGTAGVGQGIVGTLGDDLHLQRGVAETVKDLEIIEGQTLDNGDKGSDKLKETSHTKVTFTTIETSGVIRTIQ